MGLLTEGVEIFRVYWTRGGTPKGSLHRVEVKDPPTTGWSGVIVLRGEKRSTLLCPYTLESFQVTNKSAEMASLTDHKGLPSIAKLAEILKRNWAQCQSFGQVRDYDVAAKVFRALGHPIPEQIMRGGEDDTRKRGGKTVGTALTKPVKKDSKRGKFLEWFIAGGKSRSVREAMVEFEMSRSNALSYLFMLRKDHGIGYDLQGDVATVTFPEGCTDPFATQAELDAKEPEAAEDDFDAPDVSADEDAETSDDEADDAEGNDDAPGDFFEDETPDEPAPADEDDDSWLD